MYDDPRHDKPDASTAMPLVDQPQYRLVPNRQLTNAELTELFAKMDLRIGPSTLKSLPNLLQTQFEPVD